MQTVRSPDRAYKGSIRFSVLAIFAACIQPPSALEVHRGALQATIMAHDAAAPGIVPVVDAAQTAQSVQPTVVGRTEEGDLLFTSGGVGAFSTKGPLSPLAGSTLTITLEKAKWKLQMFSMWSRGLPSAGMCGAAEDRYLTLTPEAAKVPKAYIVLESCRDTSGLSAAIAQNHSKGAQVLPFTVKQRSGPSGGSRSIQFEVFRSGPLLYIPWENPKHQWATIDLSSEDLAFAWSDTGP
jgi:hypothetical protein